jgi:hypothetical protein
MGELQHFYEPLIAFDPRAQSCPTGTATVESALNKKKRGLLKPRFFCSKSYFN